MTNPENQSRVNFTMIIIFLLLLSLFVGLYVKEAKDRPWIPSFLFGTTAALMTYHWMDNASQKDNRFAGKIGPLDFQTTGALATLLIGSVVSNYFLEPQSSDIKVKIDTDPPLDSNASNLGNLVILNTKADKINLKIKASDSIDDSEETKIIPQDIALSSVKDNCLKGHGICQPNSFPVKISINEKIPVGYARLCNDKKEFDNKEFAFISDDNNRTPFYVVTIASKDCYSIGSTLSMEIASRQKYSILTDGSSGNLYERTIPFYKDSKEAKYIRGLI